MDPNATLEIIASCLAASLEAKRQGDEDIGIENYCEARNAAGDLIAWLNRGGFEPEWSRYEQATGWFLNLTGYLPRA